jgi:hypothetical protein
MGQRTVKRVPLDFDWPTDTVWTGYLTPDNLNGPQCPDCGGRGETPTAQWIGAITQLLLMVGEDVRTQQQGRNLHPWLTEIALRPEMRPGPDAAEFSAGLAGRAPRTLGHDAIDRWTAQKAIVKAAGLPEDWGTCPTCGGHGSVETYPGQRADAEAWEPFEPPTGDGWQLWETTSEGSPVSPVFESAEALADWCADNATWFGQMRATREEWLRSFLAGTTDVDSLLIVRER